MMMVGGEKRQELLKMKNCDCVKKIVSVLLALSDNWSRLKFQKNCKRTPIRDLVQRNE